MLVGRFAREDLFVAVKNAEISYAIPEPLLLLGSISLRPLTIGALSSSLALLGSASLPLS